MNKAPGGQRQYLNLGGTDNTTSPRKPEGFDHLKTLQTIAAKWVDRGYYPTPSAAMEALLTGASYERY